MKRTLAAFLLLCSFFAFGQKAPTTKIFAAPPDEFGIRCWWWWLNSNVTKASITRDLEAMKAKGFSGACVFDAGGQNQRGNADVPAGPLWGSPAWQKLFVHAVNEAERLGLELSLSIQSGWNLGGPRVSPEEAAKQTVFSELKIKGGKRVKVELPKPPMHDDFYREIAVLAYPLKQIPEDRPAIRDFENKSARKEVGWSVPETRNLLVDIESTPGEEDARLSQVIDLTAFVKEGYLNWKAPKGEWAILRMGYSTTTAEVSTSSGKWQGRVIDYLSEEAFNAYWARNVKPILDKIGSRAGHSLRYLQTDSFEAGGMNWTDNFAEEFQSRMGYDPIPYLPILAGRIIENREVSADFLNDFRKTIGELVSEHHYRLFAEKAAAYGMGIQPESAGPHAGPFDGLQNYSHSELMMSEFWSPSPHRSKPVDRFFVKQAASAAKIFNKKLVGAESFTTIGPHWNDVPWKTMKPAADHEFSAGLNLVFLHTFTNSPKEMGLPGQEYFAGTHVNPNVTWWPLAGAFFDYLKRIQYVAQSTRSVAEVLYYYGDHVPVLGRLKSDDPAGALPLFDYDLINEDKLLELDVRDGRIVLPYGEEYAILTLPNHGVLSLAVLKKLESLVKKGAIVQGEKPWGTASLVGAEQGDLESQGIIERLWPKEKGGFKQTGLGKMYWRAGAVSKTLLEEGQRPGLRILPNAVKADGEREFEFIHRRKEADDFFFISNQNPEAKHAEFIFDAKGRQPELWDPMTGESRNLRHFSIDDEGYLHIQLDFTTFQSYFVVFRNVELPFSASIFKPDFQKYKKVQTLKGAWELDFREEAGGPGKVVFSELKDWTKSNDPRIRFYSGVATYRKAFFAEKQATHLQLGELKDVGICRVKLNGVDLGIYWTPPYRIALNGALQKGWNTVEIEVVNSWRNRLIGDRSLPEDQKSTKTNITVREDWALEPSGLFGPVELLRAE
ncbi:glycoside hydrolase [Marinilongibacter aquaticus]|uniref:glycosyl hydrolase n=1 Tax=Marinilongibacter aquaticus TaxID=2975157 RepID=UPI0021BD36B4|nr:glycosyl hydrolase [Marinilongibacter aquaticus]UBM57467.1 glycoside hydrolase [Marinilongibacter aquaticus]